MEMEEYQKIDLEFESDGLIDYNQFSGAASAKVDIDLGIEENDQLPELRESMEPGRAQRNGRYNLRKSLAWDSAFFTNAGVLDAEELSSMITGADKGEKHLLPGIQEDMMGSTESISTLESDNLTLETLEDDLFVDIRASIQRSSKKASKLTNSCTKIAAKEVDNAAISSLRKEEVASQNKNPKPGLKKISGLQTVRMSKCQPKQIGKLGSGKAIKQDSGHSQMASIAKSSQTSSTATKLPKTATSSIPPSTTVAKRESVGSGRVKSECGNSKHATVSSKGTQPPKVSILSGARRALPRPAASSKSSLLGSSATSSVQSTRSSTSSDSSSNTSSGTSSKSTLMTARRNPGKSGNVGTCPSAPSGSIPKTPSRAVPKNKPPKSTLSGYLMSTKISSSVSPASSISEWSSASSSSSSMVNQRSNNSRSSLDTTSCRSVDLGPKNHSADQTVNRNENQGVGFTSNNSKKSSTQSSNLQAPMKPSGLRMPSPKIGFFDGVKSAARTPTGHQQSQSVTRSVFPKNGAATCSPIGSSNSKLKSPKVPTARTATSFASTKPCSPKVTSPASSQEKSHALVIASGVSTAVKDSPASFEENSHTLGNGAGVSVDIKGSPSLSLGVKGNATEEGCQKAEDAVIKENLVDLNLPNNMDIATASVEVTNATGLEYVDQIGDDVQVKQNHLENSDPESPQIMDIKTASVEVTVEVTNAIDQIRHDVHGKQNHIEKNSDSICEAADKENTDIKIASVEVTNAAGSECIDQIGDDVQAKQNHLEKNSDPICQAADKEDMDIRSISVEVPNTTGSEYIHQVGDDVQARQAHPEKNSDPICEAADDKNMDIKTASVEVTNATDSEYTHEIGDVVQVKQNNLEKNSGPICEAADKENIYVSFQGEMLTGNDKDIYRNIHGLTDELLSDPSERALPESAPCRAPFAPKNSFCSNECINMSKELASQVAVADNTGFMLPPPEQKENSL